MAQIAQETVITSYSGKLYSRLYAYMKPHLKKFFAAFILVLITTVLSLVQPMIISSTIDDYIEGYNRTYAVTDEANGQLCYEGKYLTKDYEELQVNEFVQMILYEDNYYLFTGLDEYQAKVVYDMSNKTLNVKSVSSQNITIISDTGTEYTGSILDGEQLKVLRSADYEGIKLLAILFAIALVSNCLLGAWKRYILLTTGQEIVYDIRNDMFKHVHSLPLRYFDTHAVGQTDTRLTNDVESLNNMYTNVLVNLFSNIIMIVGYAIVMIKLNIRMALIGFICLPIVFILTYIFRKISRRQHRVIRTKVTQLNIFLSEHISGMKLIQIFAREKVKYDQFARSSDDLFASQMKHITSIAIFRPVMNFISNLALTIIVYKGGLFVLDGSLTVGTLYLFTSYIRSFFNPIQELAEQFNTLQNAFASAEKIFTLMDEENPIKEIDNPIRPEKIKGKIEFRHVWFAYENEDYVLKDISFVINPGEKVAFVGATGAGKSSILNLIGRYYDIQKGQILIDDIDIKEMSIEQIRAAIGQVQQDVFIFTGDVKTNIALLNKDITLDQIKAAAKAVNADRFIEQLPNRYDEQLTERGSNLSFGQRQLLSFARTLVINPTILVMDEATANIDTETEQLIQDALKTLMANRTTIMVAHRLSTIQHADNIIVMHHGEIREQGTHQQLLALNGIYKNLYELQKYENQ